MRKLTLHIVVETPSQKPGGDQGVNDAKRVALTLSLSLNLLLLKYLMYSYRTFIKASRAQILEEPKSPISLMKHEAEIKLLSFLYPYPWRLKVVSDIKWKFTFACGNTEALHGMGY
jgi:hypothetical protein